MLKCLYFTLEPFNLLVFCLKGFFTAANLPLEGCQLPFVLSKLAINLLDIIFLVAQICLDLCHLIFNQLALTGA